MKVETARPVGSHLARVGVILNPRSASGRTARVWPHLRSRLETMCESLALFETQSQGHAIQLTQQALADGCRTIVAVGGDGTLNEVVNGIIGSNRGKDVVLGLVPHGTSSDFRKSAGIPSTEAEAVAVIRQGKTIPIDAMRVAYRAFEGDTRVRHAINLTSFGMGGRVAARVNRSSKVAGAKLAFLTATAVTAAGFSGDSVAITLNGTADEDGQRLDRVITNVAVGNGRYHGAGMQVCPRAVLDDGLLDVTIIEYLSLWEIARNARVLFNGRIYEHPRVHHHRARKIVAESDCDSAVEIDGEPLGYLPLEIDALPESLRLLVP